MQRTTALLLALIAGAALAQTPPWETGSYDPPWADAAGGRTARLTYDRRQSPEENGERLRRAATALGPGDTLRVGPGTWSVARRFDLDLRGTARRPIRIVGEGEGDDRPIITRPDDRQNVLNLGSDDAAPPTEYLQLANLIFTGGSSLIRIYRCRNLWIDRCELHRAGAEGITANTRDTDHLYITRNHIHHMESEKASCEGMYLGANEGKVAMSYSTIALNHVHDNGGTQGDGIEVKQGSHHNWIVENRIHDTRYPCLIVYGTGGRGVNVIERNVLYRSADNTLQVQGEAIVRNNLIVGGRCAFSSHDHQGQTRDLTFVHNTILTAGRATNLSSWNDRPGMVLANNAIYSEGGESIRFPNGSAGVVVAGNVVRGRVAGVGEGFREGNGPADFADLAADGSRLDARPTRRSALLGAADPRHAVANDLEGEPRARRPAAGACRAPGR